MSFFNESFMRAPDTGTTTAPEFSASGLTGATAASRYVGATTSGAPASGTFAVGDFIIDQTGAVWVCTAAGTPGTWTQVGGGGGSGFAQVATTGTTGYALINGTGTAIIWTTPNDGALHTVMVAAILDVATAESGGSLLFQWTDPAGSHYTTLFNGGQSVGRQTPNNAPSNVGGIVVSPNTAVSIVQNQALASGAAVLYATIFGQ